MTGDELSIPVAIACSVIGTAIGVAIVGGAAWLGRHHLRQDHHAVKAKPYDQATTITAYLQTRKDRR